ncbi:MarR family winged helix-turn-helix transcriptional regulator [Ornithinimicrobium panacihumi]|uniref:MarR family winged helix-turn-helix transcriptional regulator n=1 Tax=Ornithinimicrobium panacihumi TaxID=2008449 RepID=UPI003F88A7CA
MTQPVLPLWELIQTSHLVARGFRGLFAEHGLSPTQFGVLACLGDGDDFTKAELARAVLVTPQSMDPLIESLLERGLVARDGPPRRGRASGIRITPAGRDLLGQVLPAVARFNEPDRIGLTDSQARDLADHLRTVREHLGRANDP